MPKRIPIAAARRVAEEFGLKQCLLIGWDGEQTHVVTYGETKADCEAAAKAQDFWTGHIREFSFKGNKSTRRIMCKECGRHLADLPSNLCPGCEAYRAHQR